MPSGLACSLIALSPDSGIPLRSKSARVHNAAMRKLILIALMLSIPGCGSPQPTPLTPLQEYEAALHVFQMEIEQVTELEKNEADADVLEKAKLRLERARANLREADKKLPLPQTVP